MNARKSIAFGFLLLLAVAGAAAQQLTRVAVVDLQKVYMTYAKDSAPVRAYDEEKAKVQTEVARMTAEIKELQRHKADLIAKDDKAGAAALDAEILRKAQGLSEYYKIKKLELDEKAKKLADSSEFAALTFAAIRKVAEAEGYSLAISAHQMDGSGSVLIWYSAMVDISDKVILELVGKAK